MPRFPLPTRSSLLALLSLVFAFQCLPLIFGNSLINDEPYEITGGCYYWHMGDVITTRMQPPLAAAIQALPLVLSGILDWPHNCNDADDRAYQFFFMSNLGHLKLMTYLPRIMALLFGLGIGWLLLRFCKKESLVFTTAALVLWALDPNLIAHSGIAKSDIPLAFFFLASLLAFESASEKTTWPSGIVTGLLTGMAITTKITGLCLFPIFFLLDLFMLITVKRGSIPVKPILARWFSLAAGTALWIFLIYLPGTLLLRNHRNPFSYFWDKVAIGWRISQKGWAHFYFAGKTTNISDILYLPTAFLIKSTIPFLILLALALFLWTAKKIRLRPVEWVPPLVFTLSVLPASNFGLRIMLPALPFIYLIAARAAEWMWTGSSKPARKTYRRLLVVLILWLGISLTWCYPNYLSYGNEALSQDQKSFFIGDADLDWGQDDLRLMALAGEKGWKNIKLASFAGIDPYFYGLTWHPWTLKDLQGPQPGTTYLVDTSFFQLAPAFFPESAAIARGWISQLKPSGRLGDTWFYYDIPGAPAKDDSPKIPSVPALNYYWEGPNRLHYQLKPQ